ncbi:WhiB family transcriptional regulator [Rhodococcus sp. BH5]|uniref:WhiB family transcriptional regulator n=1 Tax=Rhodococcus sp. BH5 TaxID=2871702 RepID=UPI003FA7759D
MKSGRRAPVVPVHTQCLDFALGPGQKSGIWGGVNMGSTRTESIRTSEDQWQQL